MEIFIKKCKYVVNTNAKNGKKKVSAIQVAFCIKNSQTGFHQFLFSRRIDASTNTSRLAVGREFFVALLTCVRKPHNDTIDFASVVARFLNIDGDLSEKGAANFDRKFLRDRLEMTNVKAGDDRKKSTSDGFHFVLSGESEQIDDFRFVAGNRWNLLHQNFGALVHQMGDLIFVSEFDQNWHVSIVDWFDIRARTERTAQKFENFFPFLPRQWNDVVGRLVKRTVQ